MSTAVLKITHLTSAHKLVVPLSIKWADLEEQIHNIFSIPPDTPFLLRYRDEDGDLITLNSDLELEQVLGTGARVKFLLTLPQDKVDPPDNEWDVSSTSSFDTISEEPVLVQQGNERDEEDAVYFVDMDTEDGDPKLQSESAVKAKDKQKEKEISSDRIVNDEIFHDPLNLLHLSSQQQNQPEEHDQEMRHVEIVEAISAAANEQQPAIQEQPSDQQDERNHSTVEGLSAKFEKVIQQCCKVLGDNPEMLDRVDSIMDHVLENTPMYIEFVLNMLNSAKNQNQNTANTDPGSSSEDSSSQRYHISSMPGSFPDNTPLFQFRSGGHCQNITSPYMLPSVVNRHSNVGDSTLHILPPPPPPPLNVLPPPPPLNVLPPPPPGLPLPPPSPLLAMINQSRSAPPPQPFNPTFSLSQPYPTLPPLPGSFPSTNNDLDSNTDNYSTKLSELDEMGLLNRDQNLSLLRKYNGSIEAVIDNIFLEESSSNSGSTSSSTRRPNPYPPSHSHGSPRNGLRPAVRFRHPRSSHAHVYTIDDSAMSSD